MTSNARSTSSSTTAPLPFVKYDIEDVETLGSRLRTLGLVIWAILVLSIVALIYLAMVEHPRRAGVVWFDLGLRHHPAVMVPLLVFTIVQSIVAITLIGYWLYSSGNDLFEYANGGLIDTSLFRRALTTLRRTLSLALVMAVLPWNLWFGIAFTTIVIGRLAIG